MSAPETDPFYDALRNRLHDYEEPLPTGGWAGIAPQLQPAPPAAPAAPAAKPERLWRRLAAVLLLLLLSTITLLWWQWRQAERVARQQPQSGAAHPEVAARNENSARNEAADHAESAKSIAPNAAPPAAGALAGRSAADGNQPGPANVAAAETSNAEPPTAARRRTLSSHSRRRTDAALAATPGPGSDRADASGPESARVGRPGQVGGRSSKRRRPTWATTNQTAASYTKRSAPGRGGRPLPNAEGSVAGRSVGRTTVSGRFGGPASRPATAGAGVGRLSGSAEPAAATAPAGTSRAGRPARPTVATPATLAAAVPEGPTTATGSTPSKSHDLNTAATPGVASPTAPNETLPALARATDQAAKSVQNIQTDRSAADLATRPLQADPSTTAPAPLDTQADRSAADLAQFTGLTTALRLAGSEPLPAPLAQPPGPRDSLKLHPARLSLGLLLGTTVARRGAGSVPAPLRTLEGPDYGFSAEAAARYLLTPALGLRTGLGLRTQRQQLAFAVEKRRQYYQASATQVTVVNGAGVRDTLRVLNYALRDSVLSRESRRYQLTQHYLTLPLAAEWRPRLPLRWQPVLSLGATASWLLNGRYLSSADGCHCQEQTQRGAGSGPFAPVSMALTAGLGLDYALGLRSTLLLRPTATYWLTPTARSGAARPLTAGLQLGLLFDSHHP